MSDRPQPIEPSARIEQLEEAVAFNERSVHRLASQLEELNALVFGLTRRLDAVESRIDKLRSEFVNPDPTASDDGPDDGPD